MTALQGGPGDPTGSTPRSVRLSIIVMLVAGAASLLQSVLVLTQWDTLVAENLVRSGPPTTITGIFLATAVVAVVLLSRRDRALFSATRARPR